MSIETDLNRIATALEEIVKRVPVVSLGNPGNPAPAAPKPAAVKKEKEPKAAPTPEVDLLTGEPVAQPTPEDVHAACQAFMEKNGVDAIKALMIKHGANKVKPTISSLKPENYAALIAEAKEG